MNKDSNFEKDNAFLLSQFEEITGKIEVNKANYKSIQQKLIGLNYRNELLEKELASIKKNNQLLKAEIKNLKENLEKEHRIMPQNFNIKNKIVKIVSDIEDKEENQQELKALVGLLINEIEYCINQLEK